MATLYKPRSHSKFEGGYANNLADPEVKPTQDCKISGSLRWLETH